MATRHQAMAYRLRRKPPRDFLLVLWHLKMPFDLGIRETHSRMASESPDIDLVLPQGHPPILGVELGDAATMFCARALRHQG